MECVFCKIINHELSAEIVYENHGAIAFLDIRPVAPGHTLIAPKAHHENLLDAPFETLASMMEATQKVARAVIKATEAEGFNLGVNNGAVAGQVVFHLHLHIIPRHSADGLRGWSSKSQSEDEAKVLVQKIRKFLL